MVKRKICVVTGTRAEYGLLYLLMKGIEADNDLELQLIVTGMHLSPEFGLTYKIIEEDFKIDKKIEMLLSSDTYVGVSKSMGLAQISFAEAYEDLKPDILVVLGDRYEIFSAVSAAMIANIPIAHLDGGEATEGAFDECIRHAITKMSHLHFPCADDYRKRVIQLGEDPQRVFNFGATGIDNIMKLPLMNKEEFEQSINFKLKEKNLIITFHPVTLENSTSQDQFENLLKELDQLENTALIFTKANSDTDGRIINNMVDGYVIKHPEKAVGFTSLGQTRYLSALQYVDAVVGNSSSGIIEAPSFKIGTINIGDRQKGRVRTESIIDCGNSTGSIKNAFSMLYSKEFRSVLNRVQSPYGNGDTSGKILHVLKTHKLSNILKKKFYDIKGEDEKYR
jgi:GDP/UDP-N,N'-diacetylbacillosamine 2-epimerase (hydrolysing)